MTRKSLLGLWCVLLLAFITAVSLTSYARTAPNPTQENGYSSPQPRITQAIDERNYVSLPGNTRPEAKVAAFYRGPANATLPLEHMFLFLQRSPEAEQAVDQFITSLNDKNSPNFHKWLTPEEFGERFGVDDSDIQQVTNWLQSQGFHINQVYPNKMLIDFSGNAAQMQQAFRTQIGKLEVNGEAHIANMSDPQIPAALAPVIKGFAALNDFPPHADHIPVTQYTFAGCSSSTNSPTEPGTCYAVTPQDNAAIYNLNPLWSAGYSGQGQTIAVVEDTDVYNYPGDWNTYRSTFGLSGYSGTFTQLHPGGCTDPGANADDGEAAIDVEVATSIAPSAAIELIACPSGTFTFGGQIALQNLLNAAGPYPGVVSVSYGICEAANGSGGNAAFYNTYQQAAAQGLSVFVSSGDDGASSCGNAFGVEYNLTSLGVTGWGATPYNVSVGGTDFQDVYNAKTGQNGGAPLSNYWNASNTGTYGSAKSYIPEIPWNDSCGSVLIANFVKSSYTTYGSSGFCNVSPGNSTSGYISLGAGSGGASNCATGAGGLNTGQSLISQPGCQGVAKPSYQTGASLTGGQAVYGMPSDGVRDIPDVSMFAANGIWGHFETVCWSDPSQTSAGAASCSGAPSTWSGFGGTSVATPTMAAIQSLVNQKTGESWGNPLSYYYQMAQTEYGTAGGTFQGSACNASAAGGPASGCVFNDVTQGDIDLACENNGTVSEAHCYPAGLTVSYNTGIYGVNSTDVITGATVINGGTGYTSAPTCTVAGPSNANAYKSPTGTTLYAGGSQATCTSAFNAATTTAVWTIQISCSASSYPCTYAAGQQLIFTNNAGTTLCGPYTLAGSTQTAIATALNTWIGSNCSTYVTAARSSATVTVTSKTGGYAGNFIPQYYNNGHNYLGPATVYITNTTKGQGPGYVSSITIANGGSGYQPETPITLTGGGGSGAIAVANTTPGTAASTYQPAWGANPGYDLATGLGTPNAYNFVCSGVWGSTCSVSTTTSVSSSLNPSNYGQSVSFTATVTAGSNPVTSGTVQFVVDGTNFGSPVALNGSGQATSQATATLSAGTHSVQANYSGSGSYGTSSGSLSQTVDQAVLTVTAGSTAITYGCGCSPILTYTMTGFIGSDNQGNSTTGAPAEGTTGNQGGPVGNYPITISLGTLASTNYTFTFVNGTLQVNPATLTVTADNKTIVAYTNLPTFTASYSGFVNGDNQSVVSGSPSLTTDAPQDPPAGSYNIFAAQGTLSATNYVFTFVNGTLTVTPATAQITAPPKNTMLSGSSVTFNWSQQSSAVSYIFDLGTTPGGVDIASVTTANLTTTINGLPTNGSYIYATLLGSTDGTNYTVQDTALYVANYPTAVMISPLPNTTFSGASVTFTWVPGAASSAYWLDVGSVPYGNTYYQSGNLGNQTSATVNNLPTDGSAVYVTLWSYTNGSWTNTEYQYTAYGAGLIGVMQTPAPGSTLTGSSQQFTWMAGSQSTAYWIDAGSTQGGNQYFQSGNIGNVTTYMVTGLPTDGSTVYITLWSLVNGQWENNQYTYTAYSASSGAGQITSPTPGSTLTGSSETFNWSAGNGATAYWLDAGSAPGGNNYFQSGNLGNVQTVNVTGLPTNGSTVYVTLYSLIGGQWVSNGYQYTAYSLSSGLAVMLTPNPGSEIDGNQATFTWSAGTNASGYWLDIGTTPGANDIYQSGNLGNALSTTVSTLPNNGSEIYATLYTLINGTWYYNSYQYQSGSNGSKPAGKGPMNQR